MKHGHHAFHIMDHDLLTSVVACVAVALILCILISNRRIRRFIAYAILFPFRVIAVTVRTLWAVTHFLWDWFYYGHTALPAAVRPEQPPQYQLPDPPHPLKPQPKQQPEQPVKKKTEYSGSTMSTMLGSVIRPFRAKPSPRPASPLQVRGVSPVGLTRRHVPQPANEDDEGSFLFQFKPH
jgi:hypothetical protein